MQVQKETAGVERVRSVKPKKGSLKSSGQRKEFKPGMFVLPVLVFLGIAYAISSFFQRDVQQFGKFRPDENKEVVVVEVAPGLPADKVGVCRGLMFSADLPYEVKRVCDGKLLMVVGGKVWECWPTVPGAGSP